MNAKIDQIRQFLLAHENQSDTDDLDGAAIDFLQFMDFAFERDPEDPKFESALWNNYLGSWPKEFFCLGNKHR